VDSPLVSGAQYFDGFVFFELSGGDLLQQLERVINLPIGVLAVIAAAILVPPVPAVRGSRFDALGFASIAGAFLGLLLMVEEGSSWGWTSYPILIVACVSIDLLVVFVRSLASATPACTRHHVWNDDRPHRGARPESTRPAASCSTPATTS